MWGNQPDNLYGIKTEEEHKFSSTIGARVEYQMSKHWSFKSGVTYANTSITVNPKTIYAQPDNTGRVKYRFNTSSGYGYLLPSFSNNPSVGDSLSAISTAHNLRYIALPIGIKYQISTGSFNVNVFSGLSVNFLTRGKLETTLENDTDNEKEFLKSIKGLKKIYFSGLAGFGVDYNLSKTLTIIFAPTLKFALNSINHGSIVKSYPNSFGLETGLKVGL